MTGILHQEWYVSLSCPLYYTEKNKDREFSVLVYHIDLFLKIKILKGHGEGIIKVSGISTDCSQLREGLRIVKFECLHNLRLVIDFKFAKTLPLSTAFSVENPCAKGSAVFDVSELEMQSKLFAVTDLFVKDPGRNMRTADTDSGGTPISGKSRIKSSYVRVIDTTVQTDEREIRGPVMSQRSAFRVFTGCTGFGCST